MQDKTIAELQYIIKDASEAGVNAFLMGDEEGVVKYIRQVNAAKAELSHREVEQFFQVHNSAGAQS